MRKKSNRLSMEAQAEAALRAQGVHSETARKLVEKHGHNRILRLVEKELHLLEKLVREVEEIEEILEREHPKARSSLLFLKTSLGETTMPLTVHVNDAPGTAVYQEFAAPNGQGQTVPPTGAVLYSSSDPTIATVDPSTGKLAYLAAGQTTISANDGGLPAPGLPASDVLTVVNPAAVSSTLTLTPGA